MSHWIIGLFLTFLIIYILGRRQLLRKIRKQNKELKNALDKVEKANHMKLHFITGMGRELRTPLNVVAGFSQVLSSPDFSLTEQERKEMHERISENIDKLTNAINRMEAFSKEE
jgi:signal transduction histidine kinase